MGEGCSKFVNKQTDQCVPFNQRTFRMDPYLFDSLRNLCRELDISRRDCKGFYQYYCMIDIDYSGKVSLLEFLEFFRMDNTEFSRTVFRVMDLNHDGKIDFVEFLAAVYRYASFTWHGLVEFAFTLFDTDRSGYLDTVEVVNLVKYVYGTPLDAKVQNILDNIDSDMSGTITFDEFMSKNKRYPLLLFPAFSMQEKIRLKVFGSAYWERRSAMHGTDGDGISVDEHIRELERAIKESPFKPGSLEERKLALKKPEEGGMSNKGKLITQGGKLIVASDSMEAKRERAEALNQQKAAVNRKRKELEKSVEMDEVQELHDLHEKGGGDEEEDEVQDLEAESDTDSDYESMATSVPKRKPGEKPHIKRGCETYSKAINKKMRKKKPEVAKGKKKKRVHPDGSSIDGSSVTGSSAAGSPIGGSLKGEKTNQLSNDF